MSPRKLSIIYYFFLKRTWNSWKSIFPSPSLSIFVKSLSLFTWETALVKFENSFLSRNPFLSASTAYKPRWRPDWGFLPQLHLESHGCFVLLFKFPDRWRRGGGGGGAQQQVLHSGAASAELFKLLSRKKIFWVSWGSVFNLSITLVSCHPWQYWKGSPFLSRQWRSLCFQISRPPSLCWPHSHHPDSGLQNVQTSLAQTSLFLSLSDTSCF